MRYAFNFLPRLAAVGALATLSACGDSTATGSPPSLDASSNRAGYETAGAHRQYGTPITIGGGKVRTYVVLDGQQRQTPLEVGVAIDERVLSTLPSDMRMLHLPMPAQGPAPYDFVMFDWNPNGHEPNTVYTLPHFDFHFYAVPEADVASIVPGPTFATDASALPTDVPPYYIVPGPPPQQAVPNMGVHWLDVRSPELQKLPAINHPERWKEFTTTFIYGSWKGKFTFLEPMITAAYLRTKPDTVISIPTPNNAASAAAFGEAGWYPTAYRVVHDASAKEYRVGLMSLAWRH